MSFVSPTIEAEIAEQAKAKAQQEAAAQMPTGSLIKEPEAPFIPSTEWQASQIMAKAAPSTRHDNFYASSPAKEVHDRQQAARKSAEEKGILPRFRAKITVGGKPMNDYDTLELHENNDSHHFFTIRYGQDIAVRPDSLNIQEALAMVGKTIGISIYAANLPGTKKHNFNGIVVRVYRDFKIPPYGHIVLEGYSTTYMIDDERTRTLRSWNMSNLSKVVEDVLEPLHNFNTNIVVDPKVVQSVNYIQQHQETGYQFLRRVAKNFGEDFYFDGVNLCFGRPTEQDLPIQAAQGFDVFELKIGFDLKAVGQSHLVYDSAANTATVRNAPDSLAGVDGLAGDMFDLSKRAFSASTVNTPFNGVPTGMQEVGVEGSAKAGASQMYTISGLSYRQELRIGTPIELRVPRVDGNFKVSMEIAGYFTVTKLVHSLEADFRYFNHFEAVSSYAPVFPMGHVEEPIAQPQPGVVFANDDPSGTGMVRVRPDWQVGDGGVTDWIRVSVPDGGKSPAVGHNRGYTFVPEPGDRVMIHYENGNPDKPFVMGSLHTGQDGAGGGPQNHIKTIITRSGCMIKFDDTDGKGSITITDPSGNVWYMDGQGNISVNAPRNFSVTAGENISLQAGMNITASAGMNILESAGMGIGHNAAGIISQVAGKDYTLLAANIYKSAMGTIKTEADDIHRQGTKGVTVVSGGDIVHNSDTIVKNKSTDKALLH